MLRQVVGGELVLQVLLIRIVIGNPLPPAGDVVLILQVIIDKVLLGRAGICAVDAGIGFRQGGAGLISRKG